MFWGAKIGAQGAGPRGGADNGAALVRCKEVGWR